MKKLNLIILIAATAIAVAGIYFTTHFPFDLKQWGITIGVSCLIAFLYLYRRNIIRSKAAATAVRKSAGMSGVRKYANKMLILSLIASTVILLGTKNYQMLIPMGVAIATYILFKYLKYKVFLLISYLSVLICAIVFVTEPYIPIIDKYKLIYQVLSFQIFLFYLLPAADLFCAKK